MAVHAAKLTNKRNAAKSNHRYAGSERIEISSSTAASLGRGGVKSPCLSGAALYYFGSGFQNLHAVSFINVQLTCSRLSCEA
jgi:hypothetical protein